MIKLWSTFNENSDSTKEIISSKFLEVRELFLDFEDVGIISYSMVSSDFERGGRAHHRRGYISFDPKVGDINRFLDFQLPTLTVTSKKLEKVCIIVDIKLPGESNEFGSTVIGNEGIKLFDDMLTANSRLTEAGYDVKMDLNGSHGQYKPVKFLIYFNL
ncbi:MAG: hypothetical protein ACR2JI_11100 [Mycobacterium sp.]